MKDSVNSTSKNEIINFLKDNLSILVTTIKETDYNEKYHVVVVDLFIGDEKISSSSDSIYID